MPYHYKYEFAKAVFGLFIIILVGGIFYSVYKERSEKQEFTKICEIHAKEINEKLKSMEVHPFLSKSFSCFTEKNNETVAEYEFLNKKLKDNNTAQ